MLIEEYPPTVSLLGFECAFNDMGTNDSNAVETMFRDSSRFVELYCICL